MNSLQPYLLPIRFPRIYKKLIVSLGVFILAFLIVRPNTFVLAEAQKEPSFSETISAETFISSEAGHFFQSGEYEKAIEAINQMLMEHPQDALLRRYKAIALDRLGRTDEAVLIFNDLLVENSLHIPTHYFLGEAYARSGKADQARKEWSWVTEHGKDTPYEQWASAGLEQLRDISQPKPAQPKRWYVYADYGYAYDSNVILRPDDDSLATSKDHNAGRQNVDLSLRYRPYSRRDLAVDLLYSVRQSFHDDSLNEFNFHSEEFGIDIRKRVQVGNQDVIAGLRYDYLLGILEDDLFSNRHHWRLSADTRFSAHTRTVFYDEMDLTNFGPDGFLPKTTSRDGFYNDAGITQYFYSPDFKRYVFFREELNSGHARGKNFDSIGNTSQIGFHTPVVGYLDLDASTGLELRFYHNFSSISELDSSRRRNIIWDIYSALTYHFTDQLSLRGFYRFYNAYNQNNFYDYTRHIGGAELIYKQSF